MLPKQHSQPQLDTGIKFAYQHHHHPHYSKQKQTTTSSNPAQISTNEDDVAESDIIEKEQQQQQANRTGHLEYCSLEADCNNSNTITPIDQCSFVIDEFSSNKMQSDSVTSSSMTHIGSIESDGNESVTTIELSNAIDLATDNLPAVDTPDACDKAALR